MGAKVDDDDPGFKCINTIAPLSSSLLHTRGGARVEEIDYYMN